MKQCFPLLFLLAVTSMMAAQVEFTGRNLDPLFTATQTNQEYTEFTFQLPSCRVQQVEIDGVNYQRLSYGQSATTIEEGLPELPFFATMLGIPDQGGVEIELVEPQYTVLPGMNIYPSQGVHLDGETRGFVRDEAFYSGMRQWSQEPVTISEPSLMRGVRVVGVNINPFRFDPLNGDLTVLQSATVRLRYTRTPAGNTPVRHMPASRSFENLYAATILNWDDIRDENEPFQARSILVIQANNASLDELVEQFVDWKRTKGFDIVAVDTGVTGSTNSNIKSYIQNAYDTWENPPEFVVLVGDTGGSFGIPTWIENYSWYNGAGDYPYSLLAGNDYLPDLFIGRISIESTTHMMTFLAKMNLYEREVYMDDPSLYHHSLLVGDTSPSGLSCIITNKYVKEQLLQSDPQHTFTELYAASPNTSQMDAALNQGSLVFNYRGWIGMSGWGSSNINGLTNVNRLCNGTIFTCSTGSFNSTATTEVFFRAGTPSQPTGAVSAIGMATSGTHTQFNNILQGGLYQGMVSDGMRTMGEALVRAELSMWLSYGQCATNYAQMFIHWCNQMGDPSMDIWVAEPLPLNAAYDTEIPLGQDWLDVVVTDDDGGAMEGVWVTARQGDDDIFATGYTDASGQITLRLNAMIPGEVDLTVTKPDYIPHLGEFDIAATGGVSFQQMVIDDDSNGDSQGNNNGDANPGELIELIVSLKNWSASSVSGVSATLSCGSPFISIIDNTEDFGSIGAGGTAECLEDYDIEIMADAPDRHEAMIILSISDDSGDTWSSRMWLYIHGNDLDITAYEVVDGGNGNIDPGEQAPLRLTVTNNGETDLTDVYADLYSLNGLISEIDTMAFFGDIPAGGSATCTADPFEIEGLNQLIPGMCIELQVTFFNADGYEEIETFIMDVGTVTVDDAAGPDAYGYICFDDGDNGYDQAPDYEWIEIAPGSGGPGTDTGLSDTSDEGDDIVWIDLPFTFRFYGEEYTGITICSNGWISFLPTEQVTFRNWPLPDGLGPNAMVAAFWDDLRTSGGGVYTWFDDTTHPETPCFIIQWDAKNSIGNTNETFQILLYDQAFNPTPTGDGIIKIQYADFNNVDGSNSASGAQGNYCTVGLQSPCGGMGLQYSYDNSYAPGGRALGTNKAILFTTTPIVYPDSWLTLGDITVHDENGSGFIDAGETVDLGIYLENIGMSPSFGAFATIECYDGYATIESDTSAYRFIDAGSKGVNRSYYRMTISSGAPDGRELACAISISNADGNWSYPFFLTVHKPTLSVFSTMINDLEGNNNGVMDPGETGKLIVNLCNESMSPAMDIQSLLATDNEWVSIEQEEMPFGDLLPGESVQRVFTVTVDAGAPVPSSAWYDFEADATFMSTQSFELPMGIGDWGFEEDFEADNGGFMAYGGWQYGEPSVGSHSGTHAWATHIGTNYGNNVAWFVGTSAFFIGDNTTLSFWHYYDTQENADGGNVKLSTNNGITWNVVEPVGGYPTASMSNGNSAIGGEPGFSGDSGGWVPVTFDLAAYANDDIKLRWHFGSDGSTVAYGWAIDDVVVSGGTERSGILHGTVSMDDAHDPIEDIWVNAGPFAIHPDEAGDYTLYATADTYDLTGGLRWYESGILAGLELAQGDELFDQDLELLWLPPIDSVDYDLDDEGNLTLTWDELILSTRKHDASRRASANTQRYDYVQTNIWMQQEAGQATMVDSVAGAGIWQTVIDTEREYLFWVEQLYDTGISAPSELVYINIEPPEGGDGDTVPGFVTALRPNYPNPFNPTTTIAFSMAQPGRATVKVYNLRGQLVTTLVDEYMQAGGHTITWTAEGCASGIYLYRLEAPGYIRVRKALLLK
ncbi:MAG: T9SS type A sorting domain-containing protein [Candidatus Cloacimonetes bacterium]|nr:T9SS type A sorting domain-containing protein [Candidatus Cloacimonadota bacterium]